MYRTHLEIPQIILFPPAPELSSALRPQKAGAVHTGAGPSQGLAASPWHECWGFIAALFVWQTFVNILADCHKAYVFIQKQIIQTTIEHTWKYIFNRREETWAF